VPDPGREARADRRVGHRLFEVVHVSPVREDLSRISSAICPWSPGGPSRGGGDRYRVGVSLIWIIAVTVAGVAVLAALAVLAAGIVRALRGRPTDLVGSQLPGPPGVPVREQIEVLARDGKKIQAIKLVRERTGMGLAEAKEAVERI
jgi:hypothetical protein